MGTTTDWLRSRDAARHLAISATQLQELIDDGSLSAHRCGRELLIRREDLVAFVEASRIAPGTLGSLDESDEEEES